MKELSYKDAIKSLLVGDLPKGFNQWDICDINGKSVRYIHENHNQ